MENKAEAQTALLEGKEKEQKTVIQVFGFLPYAAFCGLRNTGSIEKKDGKWFVINEEKARQFKSCVTCKHFMSHSRTGKVNCSYNDPRGHTCTNNETRDYQAHGCDNYEIKGA